MFRPLSRSSLSLSSSLSHLFSLSSSRSCHVSSVSRVLVQGKGVISSLSSPPSPSPSLSVSSSDISISPYLQQITIKDYSLLSDESSSKDHLIGPSPYELLCSALGSCTSITIQMYTKRKNLPLEGIEVNITHRKLKKEEINDEKYETIKKSTKNSYIDQFERLITLKGKDLKKEECERILQIANMCPVHRTLEQSCIILSSLTNLCGGDV